MRGFTSRIGVISVAALLAMAMPLGSAIQAASPVTYSMGDQIVPAQMANMNPFLQTGNWPSLFRYIYNTLFYFNPVNGRLVPQLAAKGQWSDHYLKYTVTLKQGAKWQTGAPITASDVVYTYDVLKNPLADPYGLWNSLRSVSGHGQQVTFTLKHMLLGLPAYLSTVYIVPRSAWIHAGNPVDNLNRHPVGSGPFEFVQYRPGANIVLKRNPHSVMGVPKIQYLNIIMYSTAEADSLAEQKGIVANTANGIAMPAIPTLLKNPNNHLQKFPGLMNFGVFMNTKRPGLNNVDVRLAIASAIDHQALITKGELGGVFRANPGWLPSIFKQYLNRKVFSSPAYRFNLSRARNLLHKAGYKMGANGYMQKNGHILDFTYYEASGAPAQEKEASMIQGWLKQIGIKTQLRLATWPELTQLASSGQYDLLQDGFVLPPDPLSAMSSMFSSAATAPLGKNTPGLNYTRYTNPKLDQIFARIAATTDPATLRSLYDQAQSIIAQSAPIALMYNVGDHMVYSTRQFVGYDTQYPLNSPYGLLSAHLK